MSIPEVNLQKVRRHSGCCARCVIYYLNNETEVKISQLKKMTPFTEKRGARYMQLVDELQPLHAVCLTALTCSRYEHLQLFVILDYILCIILNTQKLLYVQDYRKGHFKMFVMLLVMN